MPVLVIIPPLQLAILFERHVFRRETGGGKFDAIAPDLSNATPGGYGTRGDNQYRRLQRAIALDRRAALRSTSWGIGQVMGFNAEMVGYEDVEAMVTGAESSEDEQLRAMFAFIRASKLRTALQNQDWKTFARRYNGPSFQKNDYDTKLRQTFKRYRSEGVPDVRARAAQLHLIYKGFDPGVVDGLVFVVQSARGREKKQAFEILKAHHMKSEALGDVCMMMAYDTSADSMDFVRQLRESSPHTDVKAKATFTLAQMLEHSKKAEEARPLYEEVIAKYADVAGMRGTLGVSAKAAIFEMDNLSVGKVAPEIEGEDVDGVAFKLMERAIGVCREQGYAAVILVGDQDYYERFGFRRAGEGRFTLPGPVDPHRILIRDLSEGAAKLQGMLSVPRP